MLLSRDARTCSVHKTYNMQGVFAGDNEFELQVTAHISRKRANSDGIRVFNSILSAVLI